MKCWPLFALFFIFQATAYPQKLSIEKKGCKISNQDLNKIQKISEYQAKLYNNLFNTKVNDTLTIRINLYGSRAEYKDSQRLAAPGLHKTLGFYSPVANECYIYKHPDYSGTIIHEASHCFLEHNLPRTPRWLTEGIAEFCEMLEVENGTVVFSAQADRIKLIRDMMNTSPYKLSSFLQIPDSKWGEKDQTQNLYSISYSLIYFLIKKKPNALKQMLLLMKEGYDAQRAIEVSYGGFHQFENDYQAFYKNSLIKPV